FGGTHNFMAWWDTSGTCISNCSFVSGEASSAFAVFALAALVPSPWRYPAIGMAILYGASVGLIRMAVGAHFLSDVLFAGVFIALLVWVLHGLFWRWKATAIPETVAEQRIGNTLRNLAMIRKAAIQGITNFVRGLMMRMVWKQPQQLPATQTVAPATSGQALQQ
ncbi:MAG: phosphatase PAP2 family protein, partial [Pseudorhodoplanes sp.]